MSQRQFSDATYLGLKAVCRDLVRACGGPQHAASLTRAHPGHLSESVSAHDTARFMAIDQVADLEAESGTLTVTRYLAELAGCDLTPRHAAPREAKPRSMHENMAAMIIQTADVSAAFARAMDDGHMTDTERLSLSREIDQAIEALHALKISVRPALKAVPPGEGRG
jgi:hypothetical protein